MAVLYQILADGSLGNSWVLEEKSLIVGRGEFAEAGVDDDALSRSHFLVVREGMDYFVVDLDSQNGTWANGKRISGCKLHHGMILRAGQTMFYFADEPLPTDAHPVPMSALGVLAAAEARTRLQAK